MLLKINMENEDNYDTGYGKEEGRDLYSKDPVDWEDWDRQDYNRERRKLLLAIESQKLPALEGPEKEEREEEEKRREDFSRFELKSSRTETIDVVSSLPGVSEKFEYESNPGFFDRLNVSKEGGKKVLRYRGKIIAEYRVGYTRFDTGWYFTMDGNTSTMIDFWQQIKVARGEIKGQLFSQSENEEVIPNILGELKYLDEESGKEINFGPLKRINAPILYEKLRVETGKASSRLIYNKSIIASRSSQTKNIWQFRKNFEKSTDGKNFLILALKGKQNYVDTTAFHIEREAKI